MRARGKPGRGYSSRRSSRRARAECHRAPGLHSAEATTRWLGVSASRQPLPAGLASVAMHFSSMSEPLHTRRLRHVRLLERWGQPGLHELFLNSTASGAVNSRTRTSAIHSSLHLSTSTRGRSHYRQGRYAWSTRLTFRLGTSRIRTCALSENRPGGEPTGLDSHSLLAHAPIAAPPSTELADLTHQNPMATLANPRARFGRGLRPMM